MFQGGDDYPIQKQEVYCFADDLVVQYLGAVTDLEDLAAFDTALLLSGPDGSEFSVIDVTKTDIVDAPPFDAETWEYPVSENWDDGYYLYWQGA